MEAMNDVVLLEPRMEGGDVTEPKARGLWQEGDDAISYRVSRMKDDVIPPNLHRSNDEDALIRWLSVGPCNDAISKTDERKAKTERRN